MYYLLCISLSERNYNYESDKSKLKIPSKTYLTFGMFDNAIERLGETIQIYGPYSSIDDLGNPIKTWTVDKGTTIGVVGRPNANDVLFAGGKLPDTDKMLITLSDADIATGDRVEIGGVTYDLFGTEADWKEKRGETVTQMKLYLKRVQ